MEFPLQNVNKQEQLIEVDECTKISQLDEWIPVATYAPEFLDTELDIPSEPVDQQFFNTFVQEIQSDKAAHDILLAHEVIQLGMPNKFGCHIPLHTNWKLSIFRDLLHEYQDLDVLDWLQFGFLHIQG